MLPEVIYHRVPRWESFAKYAAAFFMIPRSILPFANSGLSLAISSSVSLNAL